MSDCKGQKKWCGQGDDLRTFLGDFVAALPQIVFPGGLNMNLLTECNGDFT